MHLAVLGFHGLGIFGVERCLGCRGYRVWILNPEPFPHSCGLTGFSSFRGYSAHRGF